MELLGLVLAEGPQHGGGPLPQAFKDFLNTAFNPIVYTVLSVALFIGMMVGYRVWTKPKIALGILGAGILFFILAFPDMNFRKIVTKPDNVPIVALIFVLGFYTWWALRQAAINDEIWDLLPGYLIFRSIIAGRPPTQRTVQTLVDDVIIPALTRPAG